MSGGSLNYFYSTLEDHIGDFGDKELDDLVKDLSELFHEREWYLSGDTGSGSWTEARDSFKQKWFTTIGRRSRVENYLNTIKEEVLKSFGLSDGYCQNCAHWKHENDPDSCYGWCGFVSSHLTHRSESCEKFSKKKSEEGT